MYAMAQLDDDVAVASSCWSGAFILFITLLRFVDNGSVMYGEEDVDDDLNMERDANGVEFVTVPTCSIHLFFCD